MSLSVDEELRCRETIKRCKETWENADPDVREEALYRLDVESIEEYVALDNRYATLEDIAWTWDDATDVLLHVAHEMREV